jgi:hypothetical protein
VLSRCDFIVGRDIIITRIIVFINIIIIISVTRLFEEMLQLTCSLKSIFLFLKLVFVTFSIFRPIKNRVSDNGVNKKKNLETEKYLLHTGSDLTMK